MLTMLEFSFDANFINFASTLFSIDINPVNTIDILTFSCFVRKSWLLC